MKKKILTVCSAGLVRSVGICDVLKVHFDADAIPVGIDANEKETLEMLYKWADWIVLMMHIWEGRIPLEYRSKIKVCPVGEDTYGNSRNRELIDKVYQWTRENREVLGLPEER